MRECLLDPMQASSVSSVRKPSAPPWPEFAKFAVFFGHYGLHAGFRNLVAAVRVVMLKSRRLQRSQAPKTPQTVLEATRKLNSSPIGLTPPSTPDLNTGEFSSAPQPLSPHNRASKCAPHGKPQNPEVPEIGSGRERARSQAFHASASTY